MDANQKTSHRAWNLFLRSLPDIRHRRGQQSYQWSAWPEHADSSTGLWILCAVEIEAGSAQPELFFRRQLPAGTILQFEHQGPVETLYLTYRQIWQQFLPASSFRLKGNWEYQSYPDPERPEHIHICLPVAVD